MDTDRWELLLRAARAPKGQTRVGPAGAGLVRRGGSWTPEAPLGAEDAWLSPLLPIAGEIGVVVHLAQSLDGRIALPDGCSQWISGEADLIHTHRLRALCDAVVVGAGTVEADDPQLTVRRVPGPHPVRVVLDPAARLPAQRRVFTDDEAPTWRICSRAPEGSGSVLVDTIVLPSEGGRFEPAAVIDALRARGIRRILVEGGGITASRFLAAGVVDRLHLVIAPVLLGAGRPSLSLPEPLSPCLGDCPRPETSVHPLGNDLLIDCAFSR